MKKNTIVLAILSLALMFSVSASAVATAPDGYTSVSTSREFDGQVMGYDTATKGNWLSEDGLYAGGELDAGRFYGREAYILPFAKADRDKTPRSGTRPIVDMSDFSSWPESFVYNLGGEDDLVNNITVSTYTTVAQWDPGVTDLGSSKDSLLQYPRLKAGTLDTYDRDSSTIEGDFGVATQFTINDDDWHVVSVYFKGALETYRVALFNGHLSSVNGIMLNGKFREDALCNKLARGEIVPDAYFDVTGYQAEGGVYVSFRVKGNFTLLTGVKPDYTRQVMYGYNMHVFGYFFDPIVDDSESPAIDSVYAKKNQRTVDLQWTSNDMSRGAVLLRKQIAEAGSSETYQWKPIAVLPKGITSYTDKTVDSSASYVYALTSNKYGSFTKPILLGETFDTDEGYTYNTLSGVSSSYVAMVGDTKPIVTRLLDADGNAISGEMVYLSLAGKYVGMHIPDITYTAKTDDMGRAVFRVPCTYANQYNAVGYEHYVVTIYTEYNDARKFAPTSVTTSLTVKTPEANILETPHIYTLSDSVKGGDILNITGENLYEGAGIGIYATPITPNPEFDENLAIRLDSVEMYDPLGNFINVRLPEGMVGMYDIWAMNSLGAVSRATETTRLNCARVFWFSQDTVFEGLTIKVTGANFVAKDFGSTGETLVRLTNEMNESYLMPIVDVNPYMVEFLCNAIPVGEYKVSVSTDGINWSNDAPEQTLTVIDKGVGDPLGLGVAWANKFNYTDIFSIVDYGAISGDGKDDTIAFWLAARAAQVNGGGTVYVPEGWYYLTHLDVPYGVIIRGAGTTKTRVSYCGEGKEDMFSTAPQSAGLMGIYGLSLDAVDDNILPDIWLELGDPWGANTSNQSLRVSKYIFAKNINIVYPIDYSGVIDRKGEVYMHRGLTSVIIMDSYLLFDNVYSYGTAAVLSRCYMNAYVQMTNCHFEFVLDVPVALGSYSILENNEIIGRSNVFSSEHGAYSEVSALSRNHGLFHRDRTYIANNTIKDMGLIANDGEMICAEPIGGSYAYGRVLGTGISNVYTNTAGVEGYVGRRWVELGNDVEISSMSVAYYGKLTLVITSGKGMGQSRLVDMALTEGEYLNKYYLAESERDWDIVPDATSTYSLSRPVKNVIVYQNYGYDCTKGILLYGSYEDSIIADNFLLQTEGICVWSATERTRNRFDPNMHILVKNNIAIGTGKTGAGGIGSLINFTEVGDVQNHNTAIYHVEFRNNYIYGDKVNRYDSNDKIVRREAQATSEAPTIDGYYVWTSANSTQKPLTFLPQVQRNILFTNNYVENCRYGVYVGFYLIKGVQVDNTTYVNVDKPHAYTPTIVGAGQTIEVKYTNEHIYADRAALIADGRYVDDMLPIWATPSIEIVDYGTMAYAYWQGAYDNEGIAGYDVYLDGVYHTRVTGTSILLDRRVSSIAVYAVDVNGNISLLPISAGDSLVVNSTASVGNIALGVINSLDHRFEVMLREDMQTVKFTLTYDPNVFEYVSHEAKVNASVNVTKGTGSITYTLTLNERYSGYYDLIDTTLRVKAGSISLGDKCNLRVSGVQLNSGTYSYDYTLVNGGVRVLEVVSKALRLDFTKDGLVNSNDYNYVVGYLGVKRGDSQWSLASACDLNGDGVIDIVDTMMVYYNMQKFD
ncbi:MAG: hypothetical protein IKD20_03755 [Clostridia bacterium]|nr:hypothetical protein [Clostridia bacterium]